MVFVEVGPAEITEAAEMVEIAEISEQTDTDIIECVSSPKSHM